ncbi:PTS transporter subunit EIIC [Enterococcus sp. BWB1-3]|uniref:lactose-specific PTS transporter subunit EIIC n=1 Tax=unclassified Enterococcus TaxID=2608891 RepID=UPI001921224D|nr:MULTISPECIES: lactose-specific PTS transporter subunit EIIC [unclassified Enterococcus]MBL1227782.1 PTS transporter subunit EIIC [Enterococcus sp. BWB1-3]MCB5954561.1 lactose-specific PTS transporter subunit EIIC [Enterococcus sp. CWB-B31]
MNALVSRIEKMKPTFEKISNNPYLRAIRDGFISLIPVILFSSIFLLVAYVPNIFNFYWSSGVEEAIMKAYNYSMGILGLLMSATVAKSLTDNFNSKLPKTNQINNVSTMVAAIISFLLIGVDPLDGGLATGYMGTKGLLSAFVVGFVVPNIYRFCVKNNITVKMPEEVPGNISQTFKDLIPISLSAVFFWLFDLGFRSLVGTNFSEKIIELFQPIFSAADGYFGLALIFGAMAFFWFVGIHGPSIVEPAVAAIYITNVETNLQLYQNGEHASRILAQGTQYFVATLGGTGATLVITLMFAFLAKSKQLKTIGRASSVPVLFGVNEPMLFGAPIVLNPIFFIPFILTPILNVWLFKFFVDVLGMNGFIYNLPWTTPGPIGLIMGTGFALQAIILMLVLLVVDFAVYFPFFKVYDNELLEKERNQENEVVEEKLEAVEAKQVTAAAAEAMAETTTEKKILVLCANGATSAMLANAIKKGAKEKNILLDSTAMAYGQHKDLISEFDLIILAPQMASMLGELQEDVKNYHTKAASTSGAEYVALARTPEQAVNFVFENLA